MISKFKALINKVIPKGEESKVECAIDDQVVSCSEVDSVPFIGEDTTNYHDWIEEEYEQEPYIGIPAPAYLEYDPWFSPPVYSEKQITVKEAYDHAVADNQILEESETSEPPDIHERIYQIATASWNTVKETQGGSENFQEGPGGWNSGNGWGLYK
tara:strand:+ start:1110 stop:1577 length:468 start_codon:yes stop_codon:yes gene_type:complete